MTLDELFEVLSKEEWEDVEFKLAEQKLPANVWETVSAFANASGGMIIFGIQEKNGEATIAGVKNVERLQSDFLTTLRGEKFNVPLSATAERHEIDGKNILIFHVSEMPRQAKPIYFNNNMSNTFIRMGSGDQRCTEDEIKRFVREASLQSSGDSMLIEHYTVDDLDQNTIRKFRSYLSSKDPASPLLGEQDDFLRRIGAIARNRETRQDGITLAGLLLFGRTESILERMPNYEHQYLYVDGTEWGADQRWDDRVICQENLIETFLILMERIKKHMDSPFYMQDYQRTENTPVMVAIREALVNLLVHQDYFERMIPQIRHSRNEITFVNPGTAPFRDLGELLAGNFTVPRNYIIAKAFRMIGWAEVAGTGLMKIMQNWKEMNFEMPEIRNDPQKYIFSITLSQQHLIDEEDKKWLSQYPELGESEKLVLVAAKKQGTITNAQVRLLLGISDTLAVSQMLSRLCDERKPYLIRIGTKGPGVKYELNREVNVDRGEDSIGELSGRERKILSFCNQSPKSIKEIAEYIGLKDIQKFRKNNIQPLLAKGLLTMTHPEAPTHWNQKYFTDQTIYDSTD